MIESGEFERRNPRVVKSMNSQTRAGHLAANPNTPYGFKIRTGMKNEATTVEEARLISQFTGWCREFIGLSNADWNYRFEPKRRPGRPGELVFVFTKYEDATAFMLRWK